MSEKQNKQSFGKGESVNKIIIYLNKSHNFNIQSLHTKGKQSALHLTL